MARFDVYRMPDSNGYLLDIQASFLSYIDTRLVVPLLPVDEASKPATRLNPCFDVGAENVTMITQLMAAVPKSVLLMTVGSLSDHRDEIVSAIDFLMQGF
jgi:toxin CcdB